MSELVPQLAIAHLETDGYLTAEHIEVFENAIADRLLVRSHQEYDTHTQKELRSYLGRYVVGQQFMALDY